MTGVRSYSTTSPPRASARRSNSSGPAWSTWPPACPLEPAALCRAAIEQAGAGDDFGDGAFRRRLDVLCRALGDEAGLSASGIVSWYSQLLQFLKNRLLVQNLLTRHPEIHELRIERPIIICGPPRTGTTHLHNLIGADPSIRSLPYWESLEPVLADDERPGPGQPDPRPGRAAMAWMCSPPRCRTSTGCTR